MLDGAVPQRPSRNNLIVLAAFARLDLLALAIAASVLAGSVLFLATAWLLLNKPSPDMVIGLHLGLLSNYLPGYSVSWPGSLVGLFYGMLIGLCAGATFGALWNLIHHIYLLVLYRADLASRMDL
jgi:hypothetical protein